MKNLILVLSIISIIVSGCSLGQSQKITEPQKNEQGVQEAKIECEADSDCGQGICTDGTLYKEFGCSEDKKCVLINYVKDPCMKVEVKKEIKVEEPLEYFVGDKINIDKVKYKIKDITTGADLILANDDMEITISGTKNVAKIGKKEISIIKLNLPAQLEKRSVTLKIENIILKENEYLLDYNRDVYVDGKYVKLVGVDNNPSASIRVKVSKGLSNDAKTIDKGKTADILGLMITNIRSNPRPISVEKYAIVRII